MTPKQFHSRPALGALAVAAALLAPAFVATTAQAQNIAIVNGKAVPKSRVDALLDQATRQGGQPAALARA